VPARAAPFRCASPGSRGGARQFQRGGRHPLEKLLKDISTVQLGQQGHVVEWGIDDQHMAVGVKLEAAGDA
jgi:hypothetical protein